MLDTIRLTIHKHQMLRPKDRVLVAVSGGPDSVGLLLALTSLRKELQISLVACYVDHGLRPKDAQKEAAFVGQLAKRWDLPFQTVRVSIRKKGGVSLEESAREFRYQALVQVARRTRCNRIALGHTRDDQAETVLMWMIRGTGTKGLAGIPPVRKIGVIKGQSPTGTVPSIIRPLLEVSRKEIELFLKSHGVRGLVDRSNRSDRFLRNRIRRELLPLLEQKYNPQVRKHLTTLADTLREDWTYLDQEIRKIFPQVARLRQGKIRLNRKRWATLPEGIRRGVLRHGVERLQGDSRGFSASHWKALDLLLTTHQGKAMDLPHRFRAELSKSKAVLLRRKSDKMV